MKVSDGSFLSVASISTISSELFWSKPFSCAKESYNGNWKPPENHSHNSYNENCANANQLTATIACFLICPNIEHRFPQLRQLLVPLAHSSPRQRRVFSMIVTSTRNWLLLELRLIMRNIILGNIFRQQSTKISTYNYVCQAQITYKTVIESSVSSIIKHWLKFSL